VDLRSPKDFSRTLSVIVSDHVVARLQMLDHHRLHGVSDVTSIILSEEADSAFPRNSEMLDRESRGHVHPPKVEDTLSGPVDRTQQSDRADVLASEALQVEAATIAPGASSASFLRNCAVFSVRTKVASSSRYARSLGRGRPDVLARLQGRAEQEPSLMRLNRLDLTRFGIFTDYSIDFGAQHERQCDLHVVYGPNEAGNRPRWPLTSTSSTESGDTTLQLPAP